MNQPADHLYSEADCEGFRIVPVYQRVDASLSARIVNLWRRHRLLPAQADPAKRLRDVVCVAFDPYGELAAVNSARQVRIDGRLMFDYRVFIRPSNGVPRLKVEMTRMARELLARVPMDDRPEAFCIMLANPRLQRDEILQAMLLAGYRQWLTPKGRTAWIYEFQRDRHA